MVITKLTMQGGKPSKQPYNKRVRTDNDRTYNQRRAITKKAYLDFYHSKEWKQTRAEVLERDLYICQMCGAAGNIVDHIIPSLTDWNHRTDADNLETLCRRCHDLKTWKEKQHHKRKVKRYMIINIIVGLPSEDKLNYINKHKTNNDLILDFDNLMHALTGLDLYKHNKDTTYYIDLFMSQVVRLLKDDTNYNNVWITRTYPDNNIINLLSNYHDINKIFLDIPEEKSKIFCKKNNFDFYKIKNKLNSYDLTGWKHLKAPQQ